MLNGRLKKAAVFVCSAMLAVGTAGAGSAVFGATSYGAESVRAEVMGRILVSAGPDLSISYDKDGTVLEIRGTDRDGRDFLKGQDEYVGKSCKEAVRRLVNRLDDQGWFDSREGDQARSLVIKAERGSRYPYDRFMNEIEDVVREEARDQSIDVYIKVVGTHSLDDKGYIDRETAERMVLEQLGLQADSLRFKEYDLDDGVYEIEVWIQGVDHEVKLDAVTGEVRSIERDDDHDGRFDDDRYEDDRDDDDDDDDDDRYDDDRYDDDRYDDDRYDDDHEDDD